MEETSHPHFVICTGENSGDNLAASLIQELKLLYPHARFSGIAGPKMIAAGCQAVCPMEDIAVMGLFEVVKHLPKIMSVKKKILKHCKSEQPNIYIGVDAPDFNLRIEQQVKKMGIPTVHYNSPSVWAWRKKRIFKIKKSTDLMLTLFPHETDIYQQHQIPVSFVGHPIADEIPLTQEKKHAKAIIGVHAGMPVLGLLPGSREQEIDYLAPTFIEVAKACKEKAKNLKIITSMINQDRAEQFKKIVDKIAPGINIIFHNNAREVMAGSDVLLITSGTATLEALCCHTPMVIAYKMSPSTYKIAKRLIKVEHIGLPNLLARQRLVPEFIQDEANVDNLTKSVMGMLNSDDVRVLIHNNLLNIHRQIRCQASRKAALAIQQLLETGDLA